MTFQPILLLALACALIVAAVAIESDHPGRHSAFTLGVFALGCCLLVLVLARW